MRTLTPAKLFSYMQTSHGFMSLGKREKQCQYEIIEINPSKMQVIIFVACVMSIIWHKIV